MPDTADLAAALLRTPSKQRKGQARGGSAIRSLPPRAWAAAAGDSDELSPTRVSDFFSDDHPSTKATDEETQQLVSVLFHDTEGQQPDEEETSSSDDDILECLQDPNDESAILSGLQNLSNITSDDCSTEETRRQLICTPIDAMMRKPKTRVSRTHHLLYAVHEQAIETDDEQTADPNNTSMNSLRSFYSDQEEYPEANSDEALMDYELLRNHTVRMPKKPVVQKPTKLEKITEFMETAKTHAAIGNEDQSITFLQKAYKLADTTVAKVKHSLTHHIDSLHDKAQPSAKQRLQDELGSLSTAAIEIQTDLAILYELTAADYDQAIKAVLQASSIAKKQRKRNPKTQGIEQMYVNVQQLHRRLQRAEETFEMRKETMEKLVQLRTEGQSCLEEAHAALLLEQEALGRHHSHIGDWYIFLSNITDDTRQKQTYLLQAYDIHKQALGSKHPRTGNDLLLLAKIEQDIPNTLSYYQSAADIFCHVDDASRIVASLLNDMGVLHLALQETEIALQLFTHSLDLYDEEYFAERFQVHRNIAECQFLLKSYDDSIESFRAAVSIQRMLRKRAHVEDLSIDGSSVEETEDESHFIVTDDGIADTLRRLGKTYLAANKYEDAIAALQESADIFKVSLTAAMQLRKAGLSIDLAAKQDEVACTLYHVAQHHEAVGAYEKAIQVYNESMQLRLASDSQNAEKRNLVHCAMCLTGLANVCFRQDNFMEAHNTYNKALFFCEAQNIPFENPLVRMIVNRRQLAEARVAADAPERLEERALQEQKSGKCDQAIITLGEAISLRRAVMQKCDVDRAEKERNAIVRLLQTCREIYLEIGDKKKAERVRKEAAAISKLSRQRGRRIAATTAQ